MGLTWRRVLIAELILIGLAAVAGPPYRPVARVVVSIGLLVLGGLHLRGRSSRATWPWRLMLIGGVVAVMSAIVRLVHGAIKDVAYPYPSPADLLAYAFYLLLIAGGIAFVRARSIERHRSDLVDSLVVAATAALLLYAFVLSDYLVDASIPLFDRLGNLIYSFMTIAIIGVTARVSFGPGLRNGSYYLFAAAAFSIVINDILLLLDTVGQSGALTAASVVAPLAFAFATASILHPGSLLLADRAQYREQELSAARVALLLSAVVTGPALMLIERLRSNPQHLAVILSLWIVVAFGVLFRMILFVIDRETMTKQERSLRDLAATLTSLQSPIEMVTASLQAGLALVDSSGRARVALYEDRGNGRWEAVAVRGDQSGLVLGLQLDGVATEPLQAASIGGEPFSSELTQPLEHDAVPDLADPRSFVVVASVASRRKQAMCITVTSKKLIRRDQVAAVSSLAGQLSLGLNGVEVVEEMHQRRSNRRFRALVENSSDVVLVLDGDGAITFASPTVRRLLGRSEEQVQGVALLELVHRPDQVHIRRIVAAPTSSLGTQSSTEVRLLHGSGELRWFELEARDLSDEDEVQGIVITASDISDRKRAEAQLLRSEARFRLMVQNSSDVVAIIDDNSLFTYVSPSIERMLGFTAPEVLGRNVYELLSVTEAERLRAMDFVEVNGTSLELRIQGADGKVHAVEVGVTDMRDQPEVDGIVLNIRDVTERKTLEDDLRHQALHDDLTGLANRTLFSDRVRDAMRSRRRPSEMVAVLFVDLDDFKLINDSLGHVIGDQVLVSVGDRIQQCLRLSDVAARLGGDEFAILLTGVYGESEIVEVADRIREAVGMPLVLAGNEFRMTASIGVAFDVDSTRTEDDLLRSADLAMYQAKQDGKNRYEVFEDYMEVSAFEELELKSALARAIENDEFVLHYQPIVDMATSQVRGVEALVRWEDPSRGMVSPASFIPAAEETGLIRPIGMWVARQAATDLARWRDMGFDLYCSINVSGRQMTEDTFADEFIGAIGDSGVDMGSIVVELTESVLATEGVSQIFDAFHDVGFRIALDDFGTGFSAFQYLQTFDIDLIKIDRSFVKAMDTESDAGVVEAVLDVSRRINAKTIAEGVEYSTELRRLKELGVEFAQGYYFSRPVPADKLVRLLQDELVGNMPAPQP